MCDCKEPKYSYSKNQKRKQCNTCKVNERIVMTETWEVYDPSQEVKDPTTLMTAEEKEKYLAGKTD